MQIAHPHYFGRPLFQTIFWLVHNAVLRPFLDSIVDPISFGRRHRLWWRCRYKVCRRLHSRCVERLLGLVGWFGSLLLIEAGVEREVVLVQPS